MEKTTYSEYKLRRNLWAAGSAITCMMVGSLVDAIAMGAVLAAYSFLFIRFTAWKSESDFAEGGETLDNLNV